MLTWSWWRGEEIGMAVVRSMSKYIFAMAFFNFRLTLYFERAADTTLNSALLQVGTDLDTQSQCHHVRMLCHNDLNNAVFLVSQALALIALVIFGWKQLLFTAWQRPFPN